MNGVGHAVLAIDAGQSSIRARYQGGGDLERRFNGIRTDLPLLPQIRGVVEAFAAEGYETQCVAAGVSGLTPTNLSARELRGACAAFGVSRVLIAHDTVTSFLSVAGPSTGVVIASGTGIACLAVGANTVKRVDGWGNIIGDAGSGYWIGRAGLEAVMRAHDGRGRETTLTEPAQRLFEDLETAYIEIQSDQDRVSHIAAFAREVLNRASEDEVSHSIAEQAAKELVETVQAATRGVIEGHAELIIYVATPESRRTSKNRGMRVQTRS